MIPNHTWSSVFGAIATKRGRGVPRGDAAFVFSIYRQTPAKSFLEDYFPWDLSAVVVEEEGGNGPKPTNQPTNHQPFPRADDEQRTLIFLSFFLSSRKITQQGIIYDEDAHRGKKKQK
jgi:hypothetical protein